MLKLAVVEAKKSNCYWFTFVDEFTKKSYNGKSFQTMAEAVDYANDNIIYNKESFDLISINQPSYLILDSLNI